jgi:hypothetical protein
VVALAALGAVIGILLPDKIAIAGGFGWDGMLYGELAQNFWARLHAGVSGYHVGRLFPSLLVHYAMRILSVPFSKGNVVLGFGILNAVMLTASAWLWTRAARKLGLSAIGLWFGFVGAFGNFFVLKMVSYYPVLTDATAFFLGWAMLVAYLEDATWLLVGCIVFGRFTWPTAVPVGAILLMFPRLPCKQAAGPVLASRSVSFRAGVLAIAPALAIGAFAVWLLDHREPGWTTITALWTPAWPLSVAAACAYFALAISLLLRAAPDLLRVRTYLALLLRPSTYLKLAFLVGLALSGRALSGHVAETVSTIDLLKVMVWTSVTAPLTFLVAHATYLGPVVLVLLVGWRPIARALGEAGPGPTLCAALAVAVALDSESRHLVNLAPILVAFVAKVVDGQRPGGRAVAAFAVLSILWSKVWLVIGTERTLFFMNQGPWMSREQYAIQGGILVLLALGCMRAGLVPGCRLATPAAPGSEPRPDGTSPG